MPVADSTSPIRMNSGTTTRMKLLDSAKADDASWLIARGRYEYRGAGHRHHRKRDADRRAGGHQHQQAYEENREAAERGHHAAPVGARSAAHVAGQAHAPIASAMI